jgi:hypothetical protein
MCVQGYVVAPGNAHCKWTARADQPLGCPSDCEWVHSARIKPWSGRGIESTDEDHAADAWRMLAAGAGTVLLLERRQRARAYVEPPSVHTGRNLAVAGLAAATVHMLETPVVMPLARRAAGRRWASSAGYAVLHGCAIRLQRIFRRCREPPSGSWEMRR